MRRRMMKSKIHRATVTDANLNYVGSISIDTQLREQADILEWEQVTVVIRFWIITGLAVAAGMGIFYAEWVAGA